MVFSVENFMWSRTTKHKKVQSGERPTVYAKHAAPEIIAPVQYLLNIKFTANFVGIFEQPILPGQWLFANRQVRLYVIAASLYGQH